MNRMLRWCLLVVLLLPLLAACGGGSQTIVPTQRPGSTQAPPTLAPQITTVPVATSAPTLPAASTATVGETRAPATSTATAGETTTVVTRPTSAPATATAPAPSETATTTTNNTPDDELQYGVVAHLYYTDRERIMTLAGFANFDWIRQQVPWRDTEKADGTCGCEELDQIVEAVNSKGKKLLLSIVKAPEFATGTPGDFGLPQDPQAFARFARLLLNRYKGKVHAIEVWNEQNLAVENGGRVTVEDAGRYVEMLKAAYTAIKEIDPAVLVVAGGLSSTGVNDPALAVDDLVYLKAMYAYNDGEVKNFFDVQGFHPSNTLHTPDEKFGENVAPDAPGWSDHPTHFFRHIEDVYSIMEQSGLGDRKMWITEMGWATANNSPGYEYGNSISLDQQADYLEGALFRIKNNYPYVGAAFIWNLNFSIGWGEQGNPLHEQAAFSLLNPDWSPRPAFTRIQGWINASRSSEQ